MASALGDPNGAFGKTSLIGVGVIFAAFVMRFLWSLFQVRSRMLHLRSQGLVSTLVVLSSQKHNLQY